MFGKSKAKNLTPEKAARMIKEHVEAGLSRDTDHAIEQHPELAIGKDLLEAGTTKSVSRGSGPVAPKRPTW